VDSAGGYFGVRAAGAGAIPVDPAAGDHSWPDKWPRHDGLELAALPSAIPCARARMREVLREWALDHLAADAEVILTELAANAVQAVRGEGGSPAGPGCVRLWMLGDPGRLMLLAWDPTSWPPVVGAPAADDEHGRGLLLVQALAARWRWYYPARPYGGKVVWALLEAAPWPGAARPEAMQAGGAAGGGGAGRGAAGGGVMAGGAVRGSTAMAGLGAGEAAAGAGPRRLERAGR
jgi:hypothetical protein